MTALKAWAEISNALAASSEPSDRQLSRSIGRFLAQTDLGREVRRKGTQTQRQAGLPGMAVEHGSTAVPAVQPDRGPDLSR